MIKTCGALRFSKKKLVLNQVLREVDGDVNAAIEFLVAEQRTEEWSERPNSPSNQTDNSPCNGPYVILSSRLILLRCLHQVMLVLRLLIFP